MSHVLAFISKNECFDIIRRFITDMSTNYSAIEKIILTFQKQNNPTLPLPSDDRRFIHNAIAASENMQFTFNMLVMLAGYDHPECINEGDIPDEYYRHIKEFYVTFKKYNYIEKYLYIYG